MTKTNPPTLYLMTNGKLCQKVVKVTKDKTVLRCSICKSNFDTKLWQEDNQDIHCGKPMKYKTRRSTSYIEYK